MGEGGASLCDVILRYVHTEIHVSDTKVRHNSQIHVRGILVSRYRFWIHVAIQVFHLSVHTAGHKSQTILGLLSIDTKNVESIDVLSIRLYNPVFNILCFLFKN